jgi:hypothetical protein
MYSLGDGGTELLLKKDLGLWTYSIPRYFILVTGRDLEGSVSQFVNGGMEWNEMRIGCRSDVSMKLSPRLHSAVLYTAIYYSEYAPLIVAHPHLKVNRT